MSTTRRRVGVVLAVGDATRLPGKLLLPIDRDLICIESAILFCIKSYCKEIIVVHNCTGIIPEILRMKGWYYMDSISLLDQQHATGVMDALRLVEQCKGSQNHTHEILITFGDNVYPNDEKVERYALPNIASCRAIYDHNLYEQLDYYGMNGWTKRCDNPTFPSCMSFAGWILAKNPLKCGSHQHICDWLNAINFEPVYCQAAGWADIGTLYSYGRYLESCQQGRRS